MYFPEKIFLKSFVRFLANYKSIVNWPKKKRNSIQTYLEYKNSCWNFVQNGNGKTAQVTKSKNSIYLFHLAATDFQQNNRGLKNEVFHGLYITL